jgi:porin
LLARFQNIHGRDITLEHVGDLQVLNNVDAPGRSQVAEYIFEQHFWDRRLHLKLGKMDANADFAWVQYGLEFVHSSPGFPPVIPLPSYPDPALGTVLRVEATDWLHLAGGVYDADGSGDRWGFDSALHGPDNSITLFELAVRPVFRLADRELPGIYKVGGWYHSGEWLVLPTRPVSEDDERPERLQYRRGNSGVYFLADQLLYREALPEGETGEPDPEAPVQGLGAFFQFAWAPSAYNELTQYYGGGLEYRGLISGRDDDVTGLGVFHVSLSGRIQSVEERYSETAIELFHLIQLTDSLSLKPDLQYIANPGGDGRDAIVVGLRMAIAF